MVRADFSTDCLGARGAAAKVAKLGGRKRAEVREAAAASRRLRIVAPCTRHRPTTRVSFARARLIGVQVFLCPFDVIVMQQFAAISLRDGPRARRLNWPFWPSLRAVRRRAGGMSSSASYGQYQATDCARRAR